MRAFAIGRRLLKGASDPRWSVGGPSATVRRFFMVSIVVGLPPRCFRRARALRNASTSSSEKERWPRSRKCRRRPVRASLPTWGMDTPKRTATSLLENSVIIGLLRIFLIIPYEGIVYDLLTVGPRVLPTDGSRGRQPRVRWVSDNKPIFSC